MERGIAEFAKLFMQENDAILREATKRVSNSLVQLNPVDEGESVADWDVAVGDWPSNTPHPPDPKKRTTRARLQAGFKDVKMGNTIFFENDDPVAVRLEFGYSKKAPQGVVRATARKWRGFVRGAGLAVKNRVAKNLAID